MQLTGGRPVWRRAKATHTERESRTYTYRSLGYVDVVELSEASEVKRTGAYLERASSSDAYSTSAKSVSGPAVSDDSLIAFSQKERPNLQTLPNGLTKPQETRSLKRKNKLSKVNRPLFGPARDAINEPFASYESKSLVELELEAEREDFETLRWCSLEQINDESLPNLTSSKAFQNELNKMNWAKLDDETSDTDSQTTEESEEDENVPPPSSVVYAKSKKQKFRRKKVYGPVEPLILKHQAKKALEAALYNSSDSAGSTRGYKPSEKSAVLSWY